MLRAGYCRWVLAVALIVLIGTLCATAQAPQALKYTKSSEVKLKGAVMEVKTAADGAVHLTIKSDKGEIDVFVAPAKFLTEMEITFAKDDALEILGSQVTTADGSPMLLARELTRSGDTMIMRDDAGKPVWVGWPK
jgi:hypothetical protein